MITLSHQKKGDTTIEIKELRKNVLGMSCEEMAKFLGITKQAYWYKENGYRSFKTAEFMAICRKAEVNPLDIFLPKTITKCNH